MSRWRVAAAVLMMAAACHPAPRSPTHHVVRIEAMQFVPALVELVPGDTVTWQNADLVPHTATSVGGTWDSKAIAVGASFTLVVPADGIGAYRCTYHPLMEAELRRE